MPDRPVRPEPTAVSLAAKLAFLDRTDSYPEGTAEVDSVETHMSWVFLTDRHAYKLKKPVRYDFLDFSTLKARHADCLDEVRLNRRLAPSVYLGISRLTMAPDGTLALDREGEVVEWLVKMRRLDDEYRLDALIRSHSLRPAQIQAVGTVLSDFYRSAAPVPVEPAAYRHKYQNQIEQCTEDLLSLGEEAMRAATSRVSETLSDFLHRNGTMLDERVRGTRIIEAHGDLRPEHVFLETPPAIIDCLEFNRSFRILDPAEELAYLAMECELLDGQHVGEALFRIYSETLGDEPPVLLLDFYKAYRAFVRAKLAICHLKDHEVRDRPKWVDQTRVYLHQAGVYLHVLDGERPAKA